MHESRFLSQYLISTQGFLPFSFIESNAKQKMQLVFVRDGMNSLDQVTNS